MGIASVEKANIKLLLASVYGQPERYLTKL